jgi:hypothetical protein
LETVISVKADFLQFEGLRATKPNSGQIPSSTEELQVMAVQFQHADFESIATKKGNGERNTQFQK